MIKIADYNELQILTIKLNGCYLDGGSESIFLPAEEMPDGVAQGEYLDVFLYRDKNGSISATTKIAPATVNGYGCFPVRKIQEYGCFLDWGMGRDLFMPKRFYRTEFKEGETLVVRLIPDTEENSIIATEKFNSILDEQDTSLLTEKDEVDLIIYELIDLGARVIINDQFGGIIYANEIFDTLKVGDRRTGYIKKIREDGKIDVALQKQGFVEAVSETKQVILDALEKNNGSLPIGDKSDPEEIKKLVKMSKKMFKRTIGGLYKEGTLKISDDSITILEK